MNSTNITNVVPLDSIHHPYWSHFEPLPHSVHIAVGCIISLAGTAGLLCNIAVIVTCCSPRWSVGQNSMLSYVINLALADCFICIGGFPMMAVSSFYGEWIFGKIGCDVYAFTCGVGGIGSILNMALIAHERYTFISQSKHPYFSKPSGVGRPLCLIAAVWLYATVIMAPPLLGWSEFVLDGHGTSCTFDYVTKSASNRSYYLVLFVIGFIIPLSATATYYSLLFRHVQHHEKRWRRTGTEILRHSPKGSQNQQREMKVVKSCMLVVVTFVIAWTPYAVVALVGCFSPHQSLSPIVTLVPAVFAKMCVIQNPIIYSFTHPRFKSVFKNYCCKLRQR